MSLFSSVSNEIKRKRVLIKHSLTFFTSCLVSLIFISNAFGQQSLQKSLQENLQKNTHGKTLESLTTKEWQLTKTNLTPRHESNLVVANSEVYLLGGRGIKAVQKYDFNKQAWINVTEKTPLEIHHFQGVSVYDDKLKTDIIYIIGAFTGGYPKEQGIPYVLTFNPLTNEFSKGVNLPKERVRGAASAVEYKGHIYFVGGSTDGHASGFTTKFDRYDPLTNTFEVLPDAPIARDHAQAAVVGNKLYVLSGRQTSQATGDIFNLTTKPVDVFDFETQTWQTLNNKSNIPTPRAGANAIVYQDWIIVIGGESASQKTAHAEVEAFHTMTQSWHQLPMLKRGRHSGGAVIIDNQIVTVSGSGNRGGSPELSSIEVLDL